MARQVRWIRAEGAQIESVLIKLEVSSPAMEEVVEMGAKCLDYHPGVHNRAAGR